MQTPSERHALQTVVVMAAFVPVTAGVLSIFSTGDFLSLSGAPGAMTHVSYLSGLLLAVGVCFWSCVPHIERKGARFGLLTLIVVVGGLGRAIAMLRPGASTPIVWFALGMELAATPALFLWQRRIAALFAR